MGYSMHKFEQGQPLSIKSANPKHGLLVRKTQITEHKTQTKHNFQNTN